jgi:hypothetical protein
MTTVNQNWDILNNLEVMTLVAASPRPGSDLLHSLFDSHPEVLTFDGWLLFHKFYNECISLNGTNKFIVGFTQGFNSEKLIDVNLKNFFYEFAWSHLHKFDSRYDNLENKDQLGIMKSEFNLIDIDKFVSYAIELLEGKEFSSRNALLTIYGAYTLSKGEKLINKKILLHNVHLPEYVAPLAKDFPNLKVIACLRDPRIYASKIKVYQEKNQVTKISIGSSTAIFKMTINGISQLRTIENISLRINILEELHKNPSAQMKGIASWLGISFNSILLESTWNGRLWNGDSLSSEIEKTFDENRYVISKKLWKKDLSIIDSIVINQLMRHEIEEYGYKKEYSSNILKILTPLLIIFPTKYEINFFKDIYKLRKFKLLYTLLISIIYRYILSYQKIYRSFMKNN